MSQVQNSKQYDLEDRTLTYARGIRRFLKGLPKKLINQNDFNQLLRSSGSVGANYIEANEAISRKDFIHRIKICRKEAKESEYWLKLLELDECPVKVREQLIDESVQLRKIFGAIIEKSK